MQPLRESAGRQSGRRSVGGMRRGALIVTLVVLAVIALGACAGTDDNGTDIGLVQTQEAERNAPPPTTAPSDGSPAAETPSGGGSTAEGDPAAGQQVAQANGCLACHSIDGSTLVGPSWQGMFGHEVTLADGSTVTVDAAYITESIRNPNAKVVEGFTPTMPAFAQLSDADIANLVAFIMTLE